MKNRRSHYVGTDRTFDLVARTDNWTDAFTAIIGLELEYPFQLDIGTRDQAMKGRYDQKPIHDRHRLDKIERHSRPAKHYTRFIVARCDQSAHNSPLQTVHSRVVLILLRQRENFTEDDFPKKHET